MEITGQCNRKPVLLAAGGAFLLLGVVAAMSLFPSEGLLAYKLRARPEIILGVDKITPRKAAMLRMGLLKMSPAFCTPKQLAARSPAALDLFGQDCPEPDALRLAQDVPPSTALLPDASDTPPDVAAVSIVCASDDLFDPVKGIVFNPDARGRHSERLAWMSARLGSDLLVESPVGLRLHGGHSRGAPMKSFTVVFRENYGGRDAGPPGLFFGTDTPAARHFILINAAETGRFNGALATEIAELLGCKTSRLTPAVVYLNGTRIKAPYFLYQQQSPEFVTSRHGINDPDWKRLKGGTPMDSDHFIQWRRWINKCPAPMSMQEAGARYDLEDLSAWALAMTFTSTTDNNQGAYFRDKSDPDARWQSLVWDMDCAFNDATHRTDDGPIDYSLDPFAGLQGYRAELFFRLFTESPEYRSYFAQFAREKLDGRASRNHLMTMADRYIRLAIIQTGLDSQITHIMRDTKSFLATRHGVFWDYLNRKLQEAPPFPPNTKSPLADNERASGMPKS